MAGLVLGLGVRQLLLQGRHQDVEHLVRVLLLHVDDPAVGPEAGQQEAGVVRVLGLGRGEVVEDPGDVQQRPGDRTSPGPARSLLQPPVERGARGQGLR